MQDEKLFLNELLNPKTQNEAFRKLIREYQKPLYYHIRNIVSDHDDSDDILQNTFIKVFQNLENFKGESKLYSWIYRIATNETITFLNSKARKKGLSNEELKGKMIEKLEADIHFDGNEIQLKLHKAIASLPEKQQQVFKMKYFQELKYEEISEILKTSVGALKASYFHAVKKIEYFLNSN
ncbi:MULTISPECIES: RNA polymerase sigma factor [Flavobacterium]|uniref:RNA polymerase sigma factor n=1 Tax=Flavobacterium covae TaxID=2906076 RepID=A0ABW8PHN2_9FLAO|nr:MULTISPECIES: RNA polymerase sigma factor [Flavobacterium]OXA82963.1 RNA polymerase subunit sigma-70 [Flavobacterium columnare NBRC 100251 = ATCC 23463]AMA48841.1 RNA polymerase subunit sigma-70 [Flavobacterium covae]AND65026.1 RNA polymerase subunit sigma-70 [Flavobacterium covae]MCJ1805537.1 RNA polymerase sigma factor [Flavobacterium covae]MCJ1807918.1 RNA polymerase sigma factor [Flavobacterium covae]